MATDMGERLVAATAGGTSADLDARYPFGRVARVVAFVVSRDEEHLTRRRLEVDGAAPIGACSTEPGADPSGEGDQRRPCGHRGTRFHQDPLDRARRRAADLQLHRHRLELGDDGARGDRRADPDADLDDRRVQGATGAMAPAAGPAPSAASPPRRAVRAQPASGASDRARCPGTVTSRLPRSVAIRTRRTAVGEDLAEQRVVLGRDGVARLDTEIVAHTGAERRGERGDRAGAGPVARPGSSAASAGRVCRAPASASEYTATARRPSSWQARMIRTAISPRFATSTVRIAI